MKPGISLPNQRFSAWCGVQTEPPTYYSLGLTPAQQWLFGLVAEETLAGQPFLRIDIPAHNDWPNRTVYLSPSAVMRIEPVTEQQVREALALSKT